MNFSELCIESFFNYYFPRSFQEEYFTLSLNSRYRWLKFTEKEEKQIKVLTLHKSRVKVNDSISGNGNQIKVRSI